MSSGGEGRPRARLYKRAPAVVVDDAQVAAVNGAIAKSDVEKCDHRVNIPFDMHTLIGPDATFARKKWVEVMEHVETAASHVAAGLREYGWYVLDNALGLYYSHAALHDVQRLYTETGRFEAGQLLRPRKDDDVKSLRGDEIHWFNDAEDGPQYRFVVALSAFVDSLISKMDGKIPYTIKNRSRPMVACYPGNGTRYVTHVDNPQKDGRCITAIYYLNKNWRPADGGVLRLYPSTSLTHVDVAPLLDRLILFWSDSRNSHQVLPAYTKRHAITLWYFNKEEFDAHQAESKNTGGTNDMDILDLSRNNASNGTSDSDVQLPESA